MEIKLSFKSKKMRILTVFLCLLLGKAHAQYEGEVLNSWNFSYGRTGTPGDHIRIGLEYATALKTSVYAEVGAEYSRTKGLRYSSYSLSTAYRYYVYGGNDMLSKHKLNIAFGIGGVVQYDHEPTIYKGLKFSEKINYGGVGQFMSEYFFDPTVGFFISYEQRILSKQLLGRTNYSIGLGLRIHFGAVD